MPPPPHTNIDITRRWLTVYDADGSERRQEVAADACVMRPQDLPGLLADPGFQIAPELLAQIGWACLERHRATQPRSNMAQVSATAPMIAG